MSPFFSIIIPVFNQKKYLMDCVRSISAQDYNNYEVLLVDDGSVDQSGEICDRIAENDKRFRVIHQENQGAAVARNTGLEYAVGDYVLFMDPDDLWGKNKLLSEAIRVIEIEKCDAIIFGMKKKYGDNEITEEWLDIFSNEAFKRSSDRMQYLMEHNVFQSSAWSKIVKRDIIENGGARFVPGQMAEDIEWNLRILQLIKSVSVMPEAIYVYRQVKKSASHTVSARHVKDVAEMIKKYAAMEDGERKKYVFHYLANQYLQWMTMTNYVDLNEIKSNLREMKQFYYLLDYDWYPYVKKAKKQGRISLKFRYYVVYLNLRKFIQKRIHEMFVRVNWDIFRLS